MKKDKTENNFSDDKRKYVRILSDDIIVYFKAYMGDTDFDTGELQNISAGGLVLSVNSEPKTGEHYLLVIEFIQEGLKQSVKCMSKVKRVEKSNGRFDVAYEFRWISKDDVKTINSFLTLQA